MRAHTVDVAVVGLGAAGSAALYQLAQRGVRVLGIDRFHPPHTMGSTHGGSRIIRRAYFEGAQYLPLLNRAYELWERLEKETGTTLVTWCGCLNVAAAGSRMIAGARQTAEIGDLDVQLMSPDEVAKTFPAYALREHEVALFEPRAGAIHPERCVAAHLQLAQAHGAEVWFDEPVNHWSDESESITLETTSREVSAGTVILAVGAWAPTLDARLGASLQVERVVNAWFPATSTHFGPSHCPTFIWESEKVHSYGFPDLGEGVKAGLHYHGVNVAHPSEVDRTVAPQEAERIRALHAALFPGGLGPSTKSAVCLYTKTPDKHYLIDYLPGSGNRVVIGSACSGHGFKSSAAVGEALADLALGQAPRTSIGPFQWRWS